MQITLRLLPCPRCRREAVRVFETPTLEAFTVIVDGRLVCGACSKEQWADMRRELFHEHLEECARCDSEPFNLCPVGRKLIAAAADAISQLSFF